MRFILDIDSNGTSPRHAMKKVLNQFESKVATIVLIDNTNSCQFYNDEQKNNLSEDQINNFKNYNNQHKETL